MAIIVMAVALLIAGCTQTLYMKEGATAQQFEADKFDCEQKVVTMYGGYASMGAGHAIMARQDMDRCLRIKGYREATAEEYRAAQGLPPRTNTPQTVSDDGSGYSYRHSKPSPYDK